VKILRKNPALSYGEYSSPDPNENSAVWTARRRLINSSKKDCPAFLDKLITDVLPTYTRLAQKYPDFYAVKWTECPPLLSESHQILAPILQKWASEFNAAGEKWLLDQACEVMWHWQDPDLLKSKLWRAGMSQSVCAKSDNILSAYVKGDDFKFSFSGWEMHAFTWEKYRDGLSKQFDRALAAYEQHARKQAEDRGLVRTPRQHSPENFEWFVLYQFAGLSYLKIAQRAYGQNATDSKRSTVAKGVIAAQKLVAWGELRSSKPAE
jgi:hypothetical protein